MFLMNVLECVDCLNHDKCEWIYGKTTGKPIQITKWAIHPHLLPESSLFKIPRFMGGLYVSTGLKDKEDEFKSILESAGLKGLKFSLVWEGK